MSLNPLHLACRNGQIDKVKQILNEIPGDSLKAWDQTINGWSCMHFAARSGSLELVEYLLSQPIPPKKVFARNLNGNTCFGVACRAGHTTIAKLLLTLLAEKEFEYLFDKGFIWEDILPSSKVTRDLATWVATEMSDYENFRGLVLFGMRCGTPNLSKLRNVHRVKRLVADFLGPFCFRDEALERFADVSKVIGELSTKPTNIVSIKRKSRGVWYSRGDECPKMCPRDEDGPHPRDEDSPQCLISSSDQESPSSKCKCEEEITLTPTAAKLPASASSPTSVALEEDEDTKSTAKNQNRVVVKDPSYDVFLRQVL